MAAFEHLRYLLMTSDPVHIGTGGYQLGRVDNSIVREPGTRLPKIPGTSIHGAVRSYAAYLYEHPQAAGQKQQMVAKPEEDPICYTFGYVKQTSQDGPTNGDNTVAYAGVASIFDAHILFFPVYSMAGPVWVSTVNRLREAEFTVGSLPETWTDRQTVYSWSHPEALNLGWLMLARAGETTIIAPQRWQAEKRWQTIAGRIVLVHDVLFSQIVNSNLEVRTSVSINPQTGAAEDGALFTYEAIPRATWLTLEIVIDDYRFDERQEKQYAIFTPEKNTLTKKNNSLPGKAWTGPRQVVEAGLQAASWLGVGGMGTRGFGRFITVGEPLEQDFETGAWQ